MKVTAILLDPRATSQINDAVRSCSLAELRRLVESCVIESYHDEQDAMEVLIDWLASERKTQLRINHNVFDLFSPFAIGEICRDSMSIVGALREGHADNVLSKLRPVETDDSELELIAQAYGRTEKQFLQALYGARNFLFRSLQLLDENADSTLLLMSNDVCA